jgi:hypothetical protein
MRVEILKVDGSGADARVEFSCEHGRAAGRWSGPAPSVGARYDVELGSEATLAWGRELVPRAEGPARIEPRGAGGADIDATLEMHDADDGAAWLRIGKSLMIIDTRGDAPPVGSAVRAHVDALTLSDTGV